MRAVRRVVILLAVSLGAVTPAAALVDLGPEFQVNTYTTGPQRLPAVAVQNDGFFVVVWESGAPGGYQDPPDESRTGVFLQRFDASGLRIGNEQHVNTFTTSDQRGARVSARGDGSFVVVWESGCDFGGSECTPDGHERAVVLQQFDAAGVPQGGELLVNTTTLDQQFQPDVAAAPTGEFVVTWASFEPGYPVPDGDARQGVARQFSAAGSPAGGELSVDKKVTGSQTDPAVAMNAAGDFVVVWS